MQSKKPYSKSGFVPQQEAGVRESSPGAAWSLFLTAHALVVEQVERRLAQARLPSLQCYDALWALERASDQRLRMSEFEQYMVISRSNITRLIDRLEATELVARERHEEDRRGAYAVLTAKGKAMRRRMWPVYEAVVSSVFQTPVGNPTLGTLEAMMRRVIAAAKRETTL